jgi:hypothetical protein
MQDVTESHETSLRPPVGVGGVAWIVQRVPFQASARVAPIPLAVPTAVQTVAEAHEISLRMPLGPSR